MSKKAIRKEAAEAKVSTIVASSTDAKEEKRKREVESYFGEVHDKIDEVIDEEIDRSILEDSPERDKDIMSIKIRGDLICKKINREKEKAMKSLSEYPEWIKKIHDEELSLPSICNMLLGKPVMADSKEAEEPDGASEDVVAEPEPVVPESPKEFGEFMAEVYVGDKEKPFKVMLYPSPDGEFFACYCYTAKSGDTLLKNKRQAEEFLELGLEVIWMRVERVYEPWVPGKERGFKYMAIEKYSDL